MDFFFFWRGNGTIFKRYKRVSNTEWNAHLWWSALYGEVLLWLILFVVFFYFLFCFVWGKKKKKKHNVQSAAVPTGTFDSLQGLPSQNPVQRKRKKKKALTITFLCSVVSHSEVLLFFVVALHLYRYCLDPR